MLELLYGAKGSAGVAWNEISEGREVALHVTGWRKNTVYRLISSYADYAEHSKKGRIQKRGAGRFLWQMIFAPSIVGLCEHARESGLTVSVKDKGSTLEVRFERKSQ